MKSVWFFFSYFLAYYTTYLMYTTGTLLVCANAERIEPVEWRVTANFFLYIFRLLILIFNVVVSPVSWQIIFGKVKFGTAHTYNSRDTRSSSCGNTIFFFCLLFNTWLWKIINIYNQFLDRKWISKICIALVKASVLRCCISIKCFQGNLPAFALSQKQNISRKIFIGNRVPF